jgi:hypothetical protein
MVGEQGTELPLTRKGVGLPRTAPAFFDTIRISIDKALRKLPFDGGKNARALSFIDAHTQYGPP